MKKFERFAFGGGLLLLIWLITRLGVRDIISALERVSWGFLTVLALYTITALANTLGWRATMPRSLRTRPLPLFGFLLAGDAINSVTPSAVVGGELVRLSLLRRRMPSVPAAASVALAAATQFVAQALFVVVGLPLTLEKTLTGPMQGALAGLVILAVAVGTAVVALARKGDLFERLHAVFMRILPLGLRPRSDGSQWKLLDDAIADGIRDRPGDLAVSVGFFLLGWSIGIAEVALVLHLLGVPVPLRTAAAIEMLSVVIDAVLFFVPARLGTQEGGKYVIFQFLSLDPATGLALGLVKRIREIVWALVGLTILGFHPTRDRVGRARTRQPPPEEGVETVPARGPF